MGRQWPAAGLGVLSAAVRVWDLWKEDLIFITSTIVWPQVKQQGGNTAQPPTAENWITILLSMALPIKTRPSFPLSQSLHQEASISLLCICILLISFSIMVYHRMLNIVRCAVEPCSTVEPCCLSILYIIVCLC